MEYAEEYPRIKKVVMETSRRSSSSMKRQTSEEERYDARRRKLDLAEKLDFQRVYIMSRAAYNYVDAYI